MKNFLAVIIILGTLSSAKGQMPGGLDCSMILKAKFEVAKIKVCDKEIEVELAKNDPQRAIGLMCRETLAADRGMLFIFEEEKPLSFWMKNTKIPLSLGYFDKKKQLIDIRNMNPLSEEPVSSSKPALYALETNQGWFEKYKIHPGCKFDFSKIHLKSSKTKGQ